MRKLIVLAALLAFTGKTFADVNMSIAKDQARRTGGQTSAGVQTQPPSSPSTPMDPALAATLQNVADLKADLDALAGAADAAGGAEQRVSLLNHLSSAAAPGKKATPATIKKLTSHLIAAVSGRKNLAAKNHSLARSLHALFNGAHLSTTQQEALLTGFKKTLTEAGVPVDDADNVVADLKQVVTETQ
jgi:hypothetical protein